ncbi:MAG: GlsB/YeaQ/YmgE family stress response membrane protein [Actinobacteria bacterium]|nr:GlsB/YeaQ/YmgE family stress response membrane protein [Actinomycetota bacterium]MCB9412997.1 GlsB/YeaQ/YmgE family stress response membrane protein [Actinomycetota bacterium]
MGWVWTILGALLAGIIIGPLARLVVPGKQNISIFMTIVVGAVGALVGGLIATWLGVGDTSGIDWIKLGIQVIVAAICVVLYVNLTGKKSSTPTG